MVGTEIIIGYVFAWIVRKGRGVAHQADGEVDRVLSGSMERVHDLVSRKLGGESELARLEEEAAAGQDKPSMLTQNRLEQMLRAALEGDPAFTQELDGALREVQAALDAGGWVGSPTGRVSQTATASDNAVVFQQASGTQIFRSR